MKRGGFGKRLLIVELCAVIFISLCGIGLAVLCILQNYNGGLPWIVSMIAPAWAAYGASKASYNNKTLKESLPYIEAETQIKRDA